ncbi:SDR family NAD(P)-dependent oxidoreductase [Rhodococcus tibetensis]|uniref:SDR family NAD(P)-dependent oxidoreductase n=1 Tax=Rhodococcus tibetensis TaxID=2965064 RepID=A0ABT1QB63_9NOCA|nr:SDR family NAD(P)-dependent oxidoreductase [Rhodococcus sp. FXJ9.536]MCQ4119476.1 SDR family NAD(P)-dependent oxidoreductase [Rhodococcus sp. FXJ9.536]
MNLLSEVKGWRIGSRKHRRLRDLDGILVVVTGGGSGIGRETALAFAAQGAVVVVGDLDLESAQHTADLINSAQMKGGGAVAIFGGGSHAYQVNVAVEDEMRRFAEEVQTQHGTPDVVVNNAGIGYSGTFTATQQREFERVMDVNFWGVVYGCRVFAQQMIERGTGGHIVNLSSAAAFTPQKRLTAYATSKAAVYMLSDCLRAELVDHGIGVSTICPGIVHTNIVKSTDFAATTPEEQEKMRARADRFYRKRGFTPDRVATHIVRAVRSNKAVVPVTPEAKFGRALSRLAPGSMRLGARFDLG